MQHIAVFKYIPADIHLFGYKTYSRNTATLAITPVVHLL